MFNNKTASAGLVAIAATAGTLFTVSPAFAQSPRSAPNASAQIAAARAPAGPAVLRGDGDGDGGWWWWSSPDRFRHRNHFCGDGFCGPGFRHRFYGRYDGFARDGFGTNINRNVNVVTNDINIGVQNSNTNVAADGGY